MNPYRDVFSNDRLNGTATKGLTTFGGGTQQRVPYYRWYTKGWLDIPRSTRVLDIGCGSGQFLYFLRTEGFTNTVGIDVDVRQVEIGRALGLDCWCVLGARLSAGRAGRGGRGRDARHPRALHPRGAVPDPRCGLGATR